MCLCLRSCLCCDGRNGQFNPIGNGAGSRVYVADTGILTSHSEFAGGRAVAGYDAITPTTNSEDCNGHGTHVAGSVLRVAFPSTCGVAWWLLSCIVVGVCVAGTVAGANYGVARSATVVAVRVLSCSGSGSTSGIVAGINWIIADTAVPVRALLVVAYGDLVEIASVVVAALCAGRLLVFVLSRAMGCVCVFVVGRRTSKSC